MTSGISSLVKYSTPIAIRSKDAESSPDSREDRTRDEDDILDTILPPRTYEEADGNLWIQSVSKQPATRHDVQQLRLRLDQELERRRARETGICPIREELYGQCFDELIRQVTINCAERGLLLRDVRNELKMTIKAYETLFESGVAFGLRKALYGEESKASNAQRVTDLETETADLQKQVVEWKTRCAAIEKREAERREQETQKHHEEVDYLENYAQQLKQQLEALTAHV